MAEPGYNDAADVEALKAWISNELIPQRVSQLLLARPRRILTKTSGTIGTPGVMTGWVAAAGDGGNAGGLPYSGGIITASSTGIYEVYVLVAYARATGSQGAASVSLNRNGADAGFQSSYDYGSGVAGFTSTIAGRIRLTAGDELSLGAAAAGGTMTISSASWTIEKVA